MAGLARLDARQGSLIAPPPPAEGGPVGWRRPLRGREGGAPVLVVCEPQTAAALEAGLPMDRRSLGLFARQALASGMVPDDFLFVGLCPPVPESAAKSVSRRWAHVQAYAAGLAEEIARLAPRCVVPLGDLAARAVFGRQVAITKVRGVCGASVQVAAPVFPMLAPAHVRRVLETLPVWEADHAVLARLKGAGWDPAALFPARAEYRWAHDAAALLAWRDERLAAGEVPVLSLDTETTGLRWHDPAVRVITVQVTVRPGEATAYPIHPDYVRRFFPGVDPATIPALVGGLREVLEDPRVRKIGFGLKFDAQLLRKEGIDVRGWLHDAQLMAAAVNEDMLRKDLNESVRVWVPSMSGYADAFEASVDKSRMIDVPPEVMLPYACGDTDATFRLARVLDGIMRRDPAQYNVYRRVRLPGLLAFLTVERYGQMIDQDALRVLEGEIRTFVDEKYRELIRLVPRAVRRRHLDANRGARAEKALSFGRPGFVRDVLFSPDGFGLTPTLYTEGTADLPEEERVPQTGKDHLTYFITHPVAGGFCDGLRQLGEAEKMLSTYTGSAEERTGFWQYIAPDGAIHPTYLLHRTNTKRTASVDPNGQNWPKRSKRWARKFGRLIVARPGYTLIDCDLSQIELRIVAWMAAEPTMLRIYREGGDIHSMTAARTMRIGLDEFMALPADLWKLQRFRAKAVNFGFVYGMSWRGFQVYAKTDYELDYTEAQAQETREIYFDTYLGLVDWHRRRKEDVRRDGLVRALHGEVRHLPSIRSEDRGIQAAAERYAINSPVQCFGSDICLANMTRLERQADPELIRPVAMIHDNIVAEVRAGMEAEGMAWLRWVQETCPLGEWFGLEPPVPILGEPSFGPNLGDMVERADILPLKPPWWDDRICP